MYEVEIEVTFDAAHRLLGYEGKCNFLHGHRVSAIVCVVSSELECTGFVIDFVDLKELVKVWIDKNWDHSTILNSRDSLVGVLREHGMRVYTMDSVDPTAEHMAACLFNVVTNSLPAGSIMVKYVSIKETPTSTATYREE